MFKKPKAKNTAPKKINLPDEWFSLMKHCDEMKKILNAQKENLESLNTKHEEYKILYEHYNDKITNCVWGRRRLDPKDYKKYQKQMKKHEATMKDIAKELETTETLYEVTQKKYDQTYEQAEKIRMEAFYQ